MTKKNMDYYLLQEIENDKFYKLQKFLFEEPFKSMSNNAKVLYSVIKDRMNLSYKNGWQDNDGKVYCLFSNESMCDKLNISDKTATKYKNELIKYNLLEEKRQYSKATMYYLKKPSTKIDITDVDKNRNNSDYTIVESTSIESEKVRTNKTNSNKTYNNKTENLRVSEEKHEYMFFNDLGKDNITKWTNDYLDTGRRKITKENFELCNSRVYKSYIAFEKDYYIKFMNQYIQDKSEGRSVENFIGHLERYEKGMW